VFAGIAYPLLRISIFLIIKKIDENMRKTSKIHSITVERKYTAAPQKNA
jgi:hypothetical protein